MEVLEACRAGNNAANARCFPSGGEEFISKCSLLPFSTTSLHYPLSVHQRLHNHSVPSIHSRKHQNPLCSAVQLPLSPYCRMARSRGHFHGEFIACRVVGEEGIMLRL